MKYGLVLLCCLCCIVSASAQYEGELYAYKKDWSAEPDLFKATFIMNMVKENDTSYVCRYYRKNGPMIKWETYRDSLLEIPNGLFAWYNAKGKADSAGFVYNGKKDEDWFYNFSAEGRPYMIEELYNKGRLLQRTDYRTNTITYANGKTEPIQDNIFSPADTLTKKIASFPNGLKGWTKYLEKNLSIPERFRSIFARDTKAPVLISFTVDTTGATTDIFIHESFEWSVDMEAIRVVKASPHWSPSTINGEKVVYRHKQYITFVN